MASAILLGSFLAGSAACEDKQACRDACLEATKKCEALEGKAKADCEVETTPQVTKCIEKCNE